MRVLGVDYLARIGGPSMFALPTSAVSQGQLVPTLPRVAVACSDTTVRLGPQGNMTSKAIQSMKKSGDADNSTVPLRHNASSDSHACTDAQRSNGDVCQGRPIEGKHDRQDDSEDDNYVMVPLPRKTSAAGRLRIPALQGISGLRDQDAHLIKEGTMLICLEAVDLFEHTHSWDAIDEFEEGCGVVAAGPPEMAEGHMMIPIKPKGAVEAAHFRFADDNLVGTPRKSRHPCVLVDKSKENETNPEAETSSETAAIMAAGYQACLEKIQAACDKGLFRHDVHINLHAPVYTCEQANKLCGHKPGAAEMKNLFLRDKRKRFFLLSAVVDTELKLKDLPFGKSLGFASADALFEKLQLLPGSVTPFGLLSDCKGESSVEYYLDARAVTEYEFLSFHPNSCAATVTLHRDDFIRFIENVANHKVNILDA